MYSSTYTYCEEQSTRLPEPEAGGRARGESPSPTTTTIHTEGDMNLRTTASAIRGSTWGPPGSKLGRSVNKLCTLYLVRAVASSSSPSAAAAVGRHVKGWVGNFRGYLLCECAKMGIHIWKTNCTDGWFYALW